VSANDRTTRGFYALLATNAQLNIRDDAVADALRDGGSGRRFSVFVESLPAQEMMRLRGASSFSPGPYARAQPSPSNGWDNPPSLTSGACSLVGSWDTSETPTTGELAPPQQRMPASFSFDDAGNFVAAPEEGVDLCTSHPMYGTYDLSLGIFQLTTNVGLGVCSLWLDAAYAVSFSTDCARMTTTMNHWDNCTGGRRYFNSPTTLVKRR
jgi:hypothetical protein